MAVTNAFSSSALDLAGAVALKQPTALDWGPDGRLYVTEVDGDVKVLTVAFGDRDPNDGDPAAQFYVTDAVTLDHVKAIPNHGDAGGPSGLGNRQVTGIDAIAQHDASGAPVMIDGRPAVTLYVTSSDSRIGAGSSGEDAGLDTNSGVITRLTQVGPDAWEAVDLVRGLARSEENHALNGLEVIQEFDADGHLVSQRLIVAAGGNANAGAPSNNFAGQQEQPLSGALLEIDLDMLGAMPVLTDPATGRHYVYDAPTLDDPARAGTTDAGDPWGGNDGRNSAKLVEGGPVRIYSPGYRNAYDVEVTEDGRVFTYDNGANNSWGGRPVGEAGDDGGAIDFAQALGYIALNLNNGDGDADDAINLDQWDPSNKDQLHEATRSDDLAGRALSAGQGGAQTYLDPASGLTLVYGGHPNPTRAEGSRAGLLFSPGKGADDAYLLVSDQDSYGNGGGSDHEEVVAWLAEVEASDADHPDGGLYGAGAGALTSRVLAVTPGVLYDVYRLEGGAGAAVVAGGAAPEGGVLLGQAGLPSDIAEIVARPNPVEGDYREAGRTDGAIDTGNGSINGMTEYTSTVLDAGGVKMSGALIAASLGGSLIVMGRDAQGLVQTGVNGGGFTVAADRTVLSSGGAPLGLASLGDDVAEHGLTTAFRGSIWSAVYKQNGPLIEVYQPANGAVPLAGTAIVDETDADLDGVDHLHDPFEFSAENGYALGAGESLVLDFSPLNDAYPTSYSSTGLLGAALDGATPNRDARTAAENFPADQQRDGLFDTGGNLIPGGNAPIFQIKKVADGTVVGAANTARDVMQTGFRPADDVRRVAITVDAKNWVPEMGGAPQLGQLTGLMFGDGTQANFLRVVFGGVEGLGAPGIEVGFELGDAGYAVLARAAVPELADLAVGAVALRLEVSGIGEADGFAVSVAYRLGGESEFRAIDLGGFRLPEGVLRDVLTGDHMIGSGGAAIASGAAVGLLAEDVAGGALSAVDFHEVAVEAFGHEIAAATGSQVGAPGTAGVDTVVYTGSEVDLAPLAADVENFDGRRSDADYAVVGNAADNAIAPGSGANRVTTGAGADSVRGTLARLDGDTVTDFSGDDEVVIEGVALSGLEVGYAAGPEGAVVTLDGASITFTGPDFAGFAAEDGPGRFVLEDVPGGVRITARPALAPVVAIDAGGPGLAGAALRGMAVDFVSDAAGAAGFALTGSSRAYSNATAQAFDFPGTALDALHAFERSSPSAGMWGYAIEVPDGRYLVDLLYAEIYHGFVNGADPDDKRQFDVFLEGALVQDDYDIIDDAGAAGREVIRSYEVEVTDGTLEVEFLAQVNQAKLSGLAVWAVGGAHEPLADRTGPRVVSLAVENPQSVQDGPREARVVLADEGGFDPAALAALDGSELAFAGISPGAVSAPEVALGEGGRTATLTYTLAEPAGGWPSGEGAVSVAAGAYADAAGNPSAAASGTFILEPNLASLVAGPVALAINVGPETGAVNGTLPGPDQNTYGGAIADDPVLGVSLEADDASYYGPSSKTASNVDGLAGPTGANPALDGSALHTYRDSAAGSFTATYPIANGVYVVELWFAELYWNAAGKRVGDYAINGETVALDFDAFAAAGGADQPVKISHNVAVTDGRIVVDVHADAGQPGFNAIVVYEAVPSDLPPTISVGDAEAAEGGEALITFTRAGDLSEAVEVSFELAPGTAEAADFGAPSAASVTIAAGETRATVTVPIADDDAEEGAEAFGVTITGVSSARGDARIGDGAATVTIAASDQGSDLPSGGALFALDFEAGDPFGADGFGAALGGAGALEAAKISVAGGKLVIQTSDGDLSQGSATASKNDLVRAADLSDAAIEQAHLTTRFANPFQTGFGEAVANYAQQGVIVATGEAATQQDADQFVKLVWGGNKGTVAQLWSQGAIDQTVPLSAMSAAAVAAGGAAFGLADVASVELALGLDKAAGTVAQHVTLHDASGAILGGVRALATPGFATAAAQAMPAAVAAAVAAGTSVFGVTSSDFGSSGSFPATWDFLELTSPQVAGIPVAPPVEDDAFAGAPIGDLSDDPAAPTDLGTLALGESVLRATQQGPGEEGGRDYDYATFTIAPGQRLDALTLSGFATEGTNASFLALVEGAAMDAPPANDFDAQTAFAARLLGGTLVAGQGGVEEGGDLLGEAGLGSGEVQGLQTMSFDAPLGAGTYTLWFSQGGAPSTATLQFQVSEVSMDDILLSIADAPSVTEGDGGSSTLAFALTAPGFTGAMTVRFDAGAGEETRAVAFADGAGTLEIAVADDAVDDGDDVVSVTLLGGAAAGGTVTIGTATATGTVAEDDAATTPAPQRGELAFALNVGGGTVTAPDGTVFEADTGAGWSAGTKTYGAGAGADFDGDGDADGDDAVYATERYDDAMTYTRTGLAPGDYVLTLKFAEIYAKGYGDGNRVFDVSVNGAPAARDLDLFDVTDAAFDAHDLEVPVSVGADGVLTLEFGASADNAKVNAIALHRVAATAEPGVMVVSVEDAAAGEADGAVAVTVSRAGDLSEDVVVSFAVAGGTAAAGADYAAPTEATITILAGQSAATIEVALVDDDEEEAPETFTVTLTGAEPAGAATATIGAAVATVTIADDDRPAPAAGTAPDEDLDGDGVANASDPDADGDGAADEAETFRYDATDAGRALAPGESVTLDFGTDGTPWQNGLTGALASPKTAVSEADLANASVSGGALTVTATGGDHHKTTNSQQNAFVAAYRAPEGLRVEAVLAAPDFDPSDAAQTVSQDYQAAGVVIGTGQDDLVKAVFGRSGPQLQLAEDKGSATGAEKNTGLPAEFDYAQVASVAVALEVLVEAGVAKARGWATFLGADGEPLAGLEAVSMGEIALTGPLAARIAAGEPLGAGVIQTSTDSGTDFAVSYDSLTVTALGAPAALPEIAIAAGPAAVEAGDEGTTALAFALTTTGPDDTVRVDYEVDGAPASAEVAFAGGVGRLVVEVPNDDAASGDRAVGVTLTGAAGAVLGTAFATGTVAEDDAAPTVDAGVGPQSATPGAAFAFAVPADAFADADTAALALTAALEDGSPLPAWLAFDGTGFSGTPGAGDAGTLRVVLSAEDGTNAPARAAFDLAVGAANAAPTTSPIDAGTAEETAAPVAIDLLANAADADGDALAVADVAVVDGGGVAVPFALDGAVLTIDPAALASVLDEGESASIAVTYAVVDGRGGSAPGRATLVVEGADDAPVWYLDADADGWGDASAPTVVAAEQPAGHVDRAGDPDDANPAVHPGAPEVNDGVDNDGDGATDEDNAAPAPAADEATVASGATLALAAAELLANDADPDGDALSLVAVGDARGGTVTLEGGVVRFTPQPGFVGQASFAYTVEDGFGGAATGTVAVAVTEPEDALVETPLALGGGAVASWGTDVGRAGQDRTGPEGAVVEGSSVTLLGNSWKSVALPEPVTIAAGAVLRFDYAAPAIAEIVGIGLDGDALAGNAGTALFQIAGTQSLAAADQGHRAYATPGETVSFEIDLSGYEGRTFDRLVVLHDQDRDPASSEGTFTNLRLAQPAGANAAPEAAADAAEVAQGSALVIPAADLLANDTDADGDALAVIAVSNAQGGTVSLADGMVTFTPEDGFAGEARFDYTVSDGRGGLATASVAVAVTAPGEETGGGAGEAATPIRFDAAAVASYGDQDTTPGAGFAVGDGGASLALSGNTWKEVALPRGAYQVTADTVLRFDLTLEGSAGEILGIGLETDGDFRSGGEALFQLAGRQNFGSHASREHFGRAGAVGETVSYEIDLGAHAGRSFDTLVLVADDDRDAAVAVRFADVALVERGAQDGGGGAGQAPRIFGGVLPDVELTEDLGFELELPILDADTAREDLSFTFAGLPEFVRADGGFLSGAPGNADVGSYAVTVTATDPEGNAVSGAFTLSVENVNDAPEVVGALPDRGAVLGAGFSMPLPSGVFADADAGDVLSYAASGLPEGVTIDPATGALSGAPARAGSFEVTITASDGEAEVSAGFTLEVASGPPREEIVIEAEAFTGLAEPGSAFSARFASTASGSEMIQLARGGAGSVSTELGAAGLVPGAYDLAVRVYDEDDGASTLRVLIDRGEGSAPELLGAFALDRTDLPGQGDATQAGNLRDLVIRGVEVTSGARLVLEGEARGGEYLRTDLVRFTPVEAPADAAPAFASPAALSVAEGDAAVGLVEAADPEGGAVRYAVAGGADAALFAIDAATGELRFLSAPDFEAPADAGADNVYEVTVEASDGALAATQAIAVTVTDANDAPRAAADPAAQEGAVGAALSLPLAGLFSDQDGDALSYALVGGAPAGVSLEGGALVGAPQEAGTFAVTVAASDGVAAAVETTFTLTVAGDPSEPQPEPEGPFGAVAPGQDLDGDGVANAADPDADGDGVADADDAFAYDAADGRLLGAGGAVALEFDRDGTPYENGLTGLMQAGQKGTSALRAFDEETGTARVEGGRLIVAASNGDTGGGNDPEDDYQIGIRDRAFVVESRVENPFQAKAASNYDQLGVHVAVDSADFAKLVFGFAGGLVEFSAQTDDKETKATGSNQPLPVPLAGFAAVDLRLEVLATSASSATLTASATFLDAQGAPIAGAEGVSFGSLTVGGRLAAALFDEGVAVGAGVTQTQVGGPDAPFEAVYERFAVTAADGSDAGGSDEGSGGGGEPAGGDPANALEAFAAQGDLATSQSYGASAVGAAELAIMAGVADIDASNYGANSFRVTNLGDKAISAVFIDVTGALYPDSVFDPDGKGGDSAAKPWAINAGGGTGAFVDGTGYFLPGPDPIPNSGGSDGASNGGYRGAMVKFDPSVDGGFTRGETVGFSGDMDPNSIAGMAKSGAAGVDTGAVSGWDVGGISGHELIGSTFTVLFDDGTTATGALGSDLSPSGSHALATQAPGAAAPGLAVGGVAAGGTGTYGGTAPSVIVTGEPGQTVRVTLTKGLDPVANEANGIDALVAARLERYGFEVSNNFDSQSVDVVIGADGTADLTGAFDYADAPANNKPDFAGSDTAPLGFVAAVIDGSGRPVSPVTAPVYLTNDGGPVVSGGTGDGTGDPTGGGDAGGGGAPSGYWLAEGGALKVQFEDVMGEAPPAGWTHVAAGQGNPGAQGAHYYWGSEAGSTGLSKQPTQGVFATSFLVEEAGTYTLRVRAARDTNAPSDARNDVWVRIDGDTEALVPAGTDPLDREDGFVKLFGAGTSWGYSTRFDDTTDDSNPFARVVLSEGLHTIEFAGRSQGYHMDFFELSKGGSTLVNAPDSRFVEGDPPAGGEGSGGDTGSGDDGAGGGTGTGGGGDGADTGGGDAGTGGGDGTGSRAELVFAVRSSTDDWERFGGPKSADLEFGVNGDRPQTVGLRFAGVDIPDGAVIERAFLRFEAEASSTGPASFRIGIEGTEDAAAYSYASRPENRAYADEFEWSDVEAWSAGATYETPDIAGLIAGVIGADGVRDGALGFRILGQGARSAHAYDSSGEAPELVIQLDPDSLL